MGRSRIGQSWRLLVMFGVSEGVNMLEWTQNKMHSVCVKLAWNENSLYFLNACYRFYCDQLICAFFFSLFFLTSLFLIKTVFKHNWKFQWKCQTSFWCRIQEFSNHLVCLNPPRKLTFTCLHFCAWCPHLKIQTTADEVSYFFFFFLPLHSDICHNMEEKLCWFSSWLPVLFIPMENVSTN